MPYTSHGHAYGLINVDEPGPRTVAGCGGPGLCAKSKSQADAWQNPVDGIRTVRDQQGQHGTWNTSDYHRGLYNGLELALSILEGGRDPQFRAAPRAEAAPEPPETGRRDIAWALARLREGMKATREGWSSGRYLVWVGGRPRCPLEGDSYADWMPSVEDVLATDWLCATADGEIRWPDGTTA